MGTNLGSRRFPRAISVQGKQLKYKSSVVVGKGVGELFSRGKKDNEVE